jgi:hypothetical protein
MDMTVVLQPLSGAGFRASCIDPLPASVEGATREEALAKIRAEVVRQLDAVEIVRIPLPPPPPKEPIWPDDEFTRDWLEGIAAARAAADKHVYPWEEQEQGEARP